MMRPLHIVRAGLIGSTTCVAAGVSVTGATPVLALCRRLIEAGYPPGTPLHVYRGATLSLIVHSIDEVHSSKSTGMGPGLEGSVSRTAASPMRESGQVLVAWPGATKWGTQ